MAEEYKLVTKLSQHYSYNKYLESYGIEIETECLNPYDPPSMKSWKNVGDGSLRHFGREYILKKPLSFKGVDAALTEFAEATRNINFIQNSISTSVHVHVNILNETVRTLGNLITTFVCLEYLLLQYSGPKRTNNLFCLGATDAEHIISNFETLFKEFDNGRFNAAGVYNRDNAKYAALNIASIAALGSVEFRSFRGETDRDVIFRWVSIIESMLQMSRQDLTPKDIIKGYLEGGVSFFADLLGEDTWGQIFHGSDKEIEKIRDNVWSAAKVAFAVKDWRSFTEAPRKKYLPEELDALSMEILGKTFNSLNANEFMRLEKHISPKASGVKAKEKDGIEIGGRVFGAVVGQNQPAGLQAIVDDPVMMAREILARPMAGGRPFWEAHDINRIEEVAGWGNDVHDVFEDDEDDE